MAAIDTTTANWDSDDATSEPASDLLPEGDTTFTPPSGILGSRTNFKQDDNTGIYADGSASDEAGTFINGEVAVYYNGNLTALEGIAGLAFLVAGVPGEVEAGESTTDRSGATEVLVLTESGGVDTATFSSRGTAIHSVFTPLTIEVLDADGNPVGGDRVVFDGSVEQTTGSDGILAFQSAGTVDVAAVDGTVEETVDLSGGAASRTYQYAGVEGTVATIGGDPIAGKTVVLADDQGEVLAVDVTSPDGAYSFPIAPTDTDLFVVVDPFLRSATTRGQGQYVAKKFPSTVMQLGEVGDAEQITDSDLAEVRVDCIDAPTGRDAAAVPVTVDQFDVETGADGVARSILVKQADVEVTVGANDRYKRETFRLDVAGPESVDVELERYQETDQS